MNSTAAERRQTIQQAISSLHAGNNRRARELFERIVQFPEADASAWLGLAFACAHLGDSEATLAAVNKSLELEPENVRANVFKADHLDRIGESRRALQFYQIAMRVAARATDLPDDMVAGLQRAQAYCRRFDAQYRDFLLNELAREGYADRSSSPRFQQSLDILFGDADVYYQQPRRYYYPGLPQVQFYERDEFPWVESIEAATDDIRAELELVMTESSRFKPYLERDGAHLNARGTELFNNEDWGAYYLWHYSELMAEAAELCPKTVAALEAAPQPQIPGQAPIALFSKLRPGTHIPAHHGMLNTRLICHLPLIVPGNCGALRVGSQQRAWIEGEMLIFDDSMEHEAWNKSERERVVLLFEVWRPELNGEERQLVSAALRAVHRFFEG